MYVCVRSSQITDWRRGRRYNYISYYIEILCLICLQVGLRGRVSPVATLSQSIIIRNSRKYAYYTNDDNNIINYVYNIGIR